MRKDTTADVIRFDFPNKTRLPASKPPAAKPSRKAKAPKAKKPRAHKAAAELFWSNVDMSGGPDACWPWKLSKFQSTGYGQAHFKGETRTAHSVAKQLTTGKRYTRKSKKCLMHAHTCARHCCNPAHTEVGSLSQNSRDAAKHGRIGTRKLTADKVRRLMILAPFNANDVLAQDFGITPQHVQHILAGRVWSKVTGIKENDPSTRIKRIDSARKYPRLVAAA